MRSAATGQARVAKRLGSVFRTGPLVVRDFRLLGVGQLAAASAVGPRPVARARDEPANAGQHRGIPSVRNIGPAPFFPTPGCGLPIAVMPALLRPEVRR